MLGQDSPDSLSTGLIVCLLSCFPFCSVSTQHWGGGTSQALSTPPPPPPLVSHDTVISSKVWHPAPWPLSSTWVLVTPNSSLGSFSPGNGRCFLRLPSPSHLRVSISCHQSSNTCSISSWQPRSSNLSLHQNHLKGLLNTLLPTPRPTPVSEAVAGLGRGRRICFSIKFPGAANATGLGTPH